MAHTLLNPSFESWSIDPSEGGLLPISWVKACAGSGNAEMVTNGAFATDLTGWTAVSGWAFDSATGGAIHDGSKTYVDPLAQNISLADGKVYVLRVRVSGMTKGKLVPSCENIDEELDDIVDNMDYYAEFTANADDATSLLAFTPTATFDGIVEFVTVRAKGFSDIERSGPHSQCGPFPSLWGADFGIDSTPNICTLLGVATLVEGRDYHFRIFHKWSHDDPLIENPDDVDGGVAHVPTVTIRTSDSGHYLQADLSWSATPYAFPITLDKDGNIFSKRFKAEPSGHTSYHILISSADMAGNENGKEHCVFDDAHLEDVTGQV